MTTNYDKIEEKSQDHYGAEYLKAFALAIQADEQRNATLAALLTAPSGTSGITAAQKEAIRNELLRSLAVPSPDEED